MDDMRLLNAAIGKMVFLINTDEDASWTKELLDMTFDEIRRHNEETLEKDCKKLADMTVRDFCEKFISMSNEELNKFFTEENEETE